MPNAQNITANGNMSYSELEKEYKYYLTMFLSLQEENANNIKEIKYLKQTLQDIREVIDNA